MSDTYLNLKYLNFNNQNLKRVDIIIPFYENYFYVINLVKSIYRFTGYPYNITLVDDGSRQKTFKDNFVNTPYLNYLRNEKRIGFEKSLEIGFNASNNPLVLFLNSDCLIESSVWLDNLVKTLYSLSKNKVRVVSPILTKSNFGPRFMINDKIGTIKDTIVEEALPLTCALMPRTIFSKIGGFIKDYQHSGYECHDFYDRLKKHGFNQAISSKSIVKHFGSVTLKSIYSSEEYEKIIKDNFKLFNDAL